MGTRPGSGEGFDEQFRSFGRFNPFDAKRLLKRFGEADLRFQIDPQSFVAATPRATRRRRYNSIEIFIQLTSIVAPRAGAGISLVIDDR